MTHLFPILRKADEAGEHSLTVHVRPGRPSDVVFTTTVPDESPEALARVLRDYADQLAPAAPQRPRYFGVTLASGYTVVDRRMRRILDGRYESEAVVDRVVDSLNATGDVPTGPVRWQPLDVSRLRHYERYAAYSPSTGKVSA